MWNWFQFYPSVRIEQIGTPYQKGVDHNVATYDYIIVGGGNAGCVIANRLSANPAVKVLLLESGIVRDGFFANCTILSFPPFGRIPTKRIKLVPQKMLGDKQFYAWEGLALGGRTSINGTFYMQGCPAEYESWGKGWQWADVAPSFARIERRLELEKKITPLIEGGEWETRIIKAQFESTRQFAAALGRMDIPDIEVFDDPEIPTCFSLYHRRTVDLRGRRCSAHRGFLPKSLVLQRKNLTICLGAHVQQILFSDTENLKATGVLVEGKNNQIFIVKAKHEIILSAGAIVTPQLFGVGPKDHLVDVGIPCIHDLPGVGSTLQDHVHVSVNFYVPLHDCMHYLLANPLVAIISLIQFFLFGTGFLLSIVCEYFCYLHSKRLPPNHDKSSRKLPDLEIWWNASYGALTFPKFPKGFGAGAIMVQCATPKSTGSVRLSPHGANDIKVDPVIDPGHLTATEDWEVYRKGVLFALEVGKEMARSGYPIKEIEGIESTSNEDIDAFIRQHALSGQHLLSSCRMKPLAEGGVVDQELKVHGIDGLRIADGSTLPSMVASRPQATVAMVGERCAQFIRAKWDVEELSNDENDEKRGFDATFVEHGYLY